MTPPSDFAKVFEEAQKRLENCDEAPDWANLDNLLAKAEAIRLKAYMDILALGFDREEVSVDVSFVPMDDMALLDLAKELSWHAVKFGWYEPACKTDGGSITIYFEPEEQAQ